ncbi:hypothetical protein LR48_Vigan03g110500 [Vigna angularis]|uniref:Uncharacterized protein n=1 Tax=Phaseolus angularis TaxID=3914 RepID=A0A0L9U4H3_PHAAN|nr:hypothetical protein LR48_Vigan03g110500 [Vigna angularis]
MMMDFETAVARQQGGVVIASSSRDLEAHYFYDCWGYCRSGFDAGFDAVMEDGTTDLARKMVIGRGRRSRRGGGTTMTDAVWWCDDEQRRDGVKNLVWSHDGGGFTTAWRFCCWQRDWLVCDDNTCLRVTEGMVAAVLRRLGFGLGIRMKLMKEVKRDRDEIRKGQEKCKKGENRSTAQRQLSLSGTRKNRWHR